MKIKIYLSAVLMAFLMLAVPARAQVAQSVIKYAEEDIIPQRSIKTQKIILCQNQHPMRVAGFVTNPPFGWMDIVPGSGINPDRYYNDGFAYQLFLKLAKDLNVEVEGIGFKSYYEALNALKQGRIDVLLGSYYDKRTLGAGTSVLFPGYFSNPVIVVFVKGRERDVKSLEDLKGLKGVIRQEEMLYSLLFRTIPDLVKIEQVTGARKAYTMLLNGQADFMITSLYAAESEMRRFKIADKVVLTQTPLIQPELFFVFGANSKCLPLKKMFSDQLKKEKEIPGAINNLLFQQIDKWIERFRYAPPLTDEINTRAAPVVQEIVEDKLPESQEGE